MNKREALRFAAGELEELAAELARDYSPCGLDSSAGAVIPEEWTDRDVRRVVAAFEELRYRMDRIATGAKRKPKPRSADPNQAALFE